MLTRAAHLSQHTPFAWSYIDKPPGKYEHVCMSGLNFVNLIFTSLTTKIISYHIEGNIFVIFVSPQLPFPSDGIRYQDQEQRYVIPAGNNRVRTDNATAWPLVG